MAINYQLFLFLCIVAMLSVMARKLTIMGAVCGVIVGYTVFIGSGGTGIALLGSFFLLGVMATAHGRGLKEALSVPEKDKGGRTAGQVLANAGVAAVMAFLAYSYPQHRGLFRLMMAASLSSAMADTLSSELGMVYGRRFYDILSWRAGKRGDNGLVSMEGTIAGIAGSAVIGGIYVIGYGWSSSFIWIIIAGTFGNISDSVLGATLERRLILGNNAVNFFNTVTAAVIICVSQWV